MSAQIRKMSMLRPNSVSSIPASLLVVFALFVFLPVQVFASDFYRPWRNKNTAIVLDAYELNSLDWERIVRDKRIMGFIGKASDGLSPKYCSTGNKTMCGVTWRKYAVARELYRTRRQLARALGLKWGAYHLGRRGNPEQQALHFLQYADPKADEIIVLDIESLDGNKFMTLSEAERFAKYIHKRIERYPMLYTNHSTARHIAANVEKYPLLSRLKLWYARYKPSISGAFPMGHWDKYAIWQFAYGGNCRSRCPYRVKGTPRDIDVNVIGMSVEEARAAWPFDGLVPERIVPDEKEEILLVNTVEYPEEEKHSDYVLDADYNPDEELNTGAVTGLPDVLKEVPVTSVALETPVLLQRAIAKRDAPAKIKTIGACDENGFREGLDGLESC